MTAVEVFAPAKINLSLHITGQREDGYHLLDSLVVFAPVGDCITITPGNALSLTVEGPEAKGVPADMDNLAFRGAMLAAPGCGAVLVLEKNLPAASGIGGGSTDAAAAFRGMLFFGNEGETPAETASAMPDTILENNARELLKLGADVPMCLLPKPLRAQGIGENISFLDLPPLPAVLVNPRVAVPTPSIFKALGSKFNSPMPDPIPNVLTARDLIAFLQDCRNDLEAPALSLAPQIGTVLKRLAQTDGCKLARMSGSGATCFGLFETEAEAQAACEKLWSDHPAWWVASCVLGDQSKAASPRRVS